MDKIEEMIRNNKDFFDHEEPREGHLKRFRKKLESERRMNHQFMIRIAAIIVSGILIASISNFLINRDMDGTDDISNLDPEIKEAIFFYNRMSDNLKKEIEALPIKDESQKNEILKDIENYDKNYRSLIDDLNNYPENERLIHVLIEYHKEKTEFLSHIINQFNDIYDKQTI